MLPKIHSILNNMSSSTTGKTPYEIAYGFFLRRSFNLLSDLLLPSIFQACTDVTNVISFALANQKAYYDQKYQLLFMKVGDWAILKLHKGYSILSSVGVTKKLIQQYVGPFRVLEKIVRFTYKLDMPYNWRVHPVFLVA